MPAIEKIPDEDLVPPVGLVALCHHRWAIPVLATLGPSGGAKFVTLTKSLGVPRATLTRTLEALIENDFVLRNPGYGHPMRPEYLLSPFGESAAPPCAGAWSFMQEHDLFDLLGRKWPLPVIWSIRCGHDRFNDLLAFLPGLTPRALTSALRALEDAGLVDRTVSQDRPPAVCYAITPACRPIARLALALARAIDF